MVPGTGTTLVFTVEPGGGSDGQIWNTQPQVTVYDASNNIDTTFVGNITLSIGAGPGGTPAISCSGNSTQQAVSGGVATFTGCNIVGPAGTTYELDAKDNALSGVSTAFAITAGQPAELAFQTNPSNSFGGSPIAGPPVVEVEDIDGQLVNTDSSSILKISITAGSGAAGAKLTCTTNPITVTNGLASFAGCSINLASVNNYTLTATDTNDTGVIDPAVSFPFTVGAGAATQLAFSPQPAGAQTGVAMGSFSVKIEDAGGNVVASTSGITLAIGTNPGGGVPTGCAASTLAGVATFTACQISKAGNGYTLIATDTTDTLNVTSSAFNITGAPTQLSFALPSGTQPGGASAGSPFTQQPVVAIEDANGIVVPTATGNVTLTFNVGIVIGGGTAALSGWHGPGCSCRRYRDLLRLPGQQGKRARYSTAASGTLPNDNSAIFEVAGAPTKLVFTTQPGGASAGSPFTQQPVVAVEDVLDNIVTSEQTTSVTLTYTPGNPAGGTISGCTAMFSNGVATFTGCTVSAASQGADLTAQSTGPVLPNVNSNNFNVAGPPKQLNFTTNPGEAVAGEAFGQQPVVQILDCKREPCNE